MAGPGRTLPYSRSEFRPMEPPMDTARTRTNRRFTITAVLSVLLLVLTALPAGADHFDPTPGFLDPVWRQVHPGRNDSSAPTVGDLDGDGVDEIIVGALDGYVRAYRADGTMMPGFPAPAVIEGQRTPSAISSSPLVADLDNDGVPEIVVGVGSLQVPNQQGGVVALDNRGRRLWSHQGFDTYDMWDDGPADGYTEGVYSSPASGDVDGDGFPDVVFGGWDHRIWALDRNGDVVPGFPFVNADTVWGSPALYDVDDDGRLEIFIGGDSSIGTLTDFHWSGGRFRALDWSNGVVSQMWQNLSRDIFQSSASMADIDGDGRMDIVVGGAVPRLNDDDARKVWAWHADDGSSLPGFPVNLPNPVFSTPALGDVDGDGRVEIVVATLSRPGVSGRITVIEADGSIQFAVDPLEGDFPGAVVEFLGSPVFADTDGDGGLDIIVSSNIGTFVVDGSDGHRLPSGFLNRNEAWSGAGSPLVARFGSAGWRLVVPTYVVGAGTGILTSYRLPDQPADNPWPMWRRSPLHRAAPDSGGDPLPPGFCRRSVNPTSHPDSTSASGYWILDAAGTVTAFDAPHYGDLSRTPLPPGVTAVAITETASGNGYWILDSAGGVHTFGDARFLGSMQGLDLKAPIVSMAALPTGDGYWLLGADGGVFSFGAAPFHGSTGALSLRAPIISMAPTNDGRGYWLLASDGGVFSFGSARFHGSTGAMTLAAPVISMAVDPNGHGYWLLGADGGVFSFGVPFWGSVPGLGLCDRATAIELRPTSDGRGYYALGDTGGIYTFGNAWFRGAAPGSRPVDLAVRD